MKKLDKIRSKDLKAPKYFFTYFNQENGEYKHPRIHIHVAHWNEGKTHWMGYKTAVTIEWQQSRDDSGEWKCPYGVHAEIGYDSRDCLGDSIQILQKLHKSKVLQWDNGLRHMMRFLAKNRIFRYVWQDVSTFDEISKTQGKSSYYVPWQYRHISQSFVDAQMVMA